MHTSTNSGRMDGSFASSPRMSTFRAGLATDASSGPASGSACCTASAQAKASLEG